MSLILPLAFTIGTETISLPRTQGPDNRKAHYEFMRDDGTRSYTAMIGHTVPKSILDKRSSVYQLIAQDYDTAGLPGRGYQIHMVWKSWGGQRVGSEMDNLHAGFLANLSADAAANYAAIQSLEL